MASTEKVDLIVIATHGVTGWRHLVFGSVAEKTIRLAEQPVLVMPTHDAKDGWSVSWQDATIRLR
jgi:nucleotide-binding universal stress UspA family protein